MVVTYAHCVPVVFDTKPSLSLSYLDHSRSLSDQTIDSVNTDLFRRSSDRPELKFHDPNGPPPFKGNTLSDLKTIFSSPPSKAKAAQKDKKEVKIPNHNWIKSITKTLTEKGGHAQGSKKSGQEIEMQEVFKSGKGQ